MFIPVKFLLIRFSLFLRSFWISILTLNLPAILSQLLSHTPVVSVTMISSLTEIMNRTRYEKSPAALQKFP